MPLKMEEGTTKDAGGHQKLEMMGNRVFPRRLQKEHSPLVSDQ